MRVGFLMISRKPRKMLLACTTGSLLQMRMLRSRDNWFRILVNRAGQFRGSWVVVVEPRIPETKIRIIFACPLLLKRIVTEAWGTCSSYLDAGRWLRRLRLQIGSWGDDRSETLPLKSLAFIIKQQISKDFKRYSKSFFLQRHFIFEFHFDHL